MTTHFRADQVDPAAWEWLVGVLQNPDQVLRALREQTQVRDVENEPQRRHLRDIEDLIADNEQKRDRILDLYLDGRFEKESLMERKSRLDSTLAGLERERATLRASMRSHGPTQDQIRTALEMADAVRDGIAWADLDFDRRRELVDLLDLQAVLTVENAERVAYLIPIAWSKAVFSSSS